MWIHEGMTAFPKLKLKTVPGMDPIMQFQQTESVPDGDLGMARVDVSVSLCLSLVCLGAGSWARKLARCLECSSRVAESGRASSQDALEHLVPQTLRNEPCSWHDIFTSGSRKWK